MTHALLPLSLAGPGNQYCGLKEAVIMARVLGRSLVLPHIIPHYTIRGSSKSHYLFAETFDEPVFIERCGSLMGLEVIPWAEYKQKWPHTEQISAVNIRKDEVSQRQAMEYFGLYRDEMGFPLMDEEVQESLSPRAILDSPEAIVHWYETVCDSDPELLVIAGLFNNLKLGGINRITEQAACLKNHCLNCRPSPAFDEMYQLANLAFRLNAEVARAGESYIAKRFQERPFLSFHLRICDIPKKRSFSECYAGYSEIQLQRALARVTSKFSIQANDVFLAAPPQLFSEVRDLKVFTRENMHTLDSPAYDPYFAALVEQYICMRSRVFLRSYTNTPDQPLKPHSRSSYSELIEGMRRGDPAKPSFTVDDFIEPHTESKEAGGLSFSFQINPGL